MIALDLLSNDIIPLRTSDTGEDALEMMRDFIVQHLPIVNDEELLGLVGENDILDHDVLEPVGSYNLSSKHAKVLESDHLYEVMRLVAQYELTAVPVVDNNEKYKGLITASDLLMYYARTSNFVETGSIIVLAVQRRDYSLSEIARIAESENAIILSSFVESMGDGSLLRVTIKVNVQNVNGILSTFERFGYKIFATFNENLELDTLKERYDGLIRYLNI